MFVEFLIQRTATARFQSKQSEYLDMSTFPSKRKEKYVRFNKNSPKRNLVITNLFTFEKKLTEYSTPLKGSAFTLNKVAFIARARHVYGSYCDKTRKCSATLDTRKHPRIS